MYMFGAIKPILNVKAKAIAAYTDAETTHYSWIKFHVPVY